MSRHRTELERVEAGLAFVGKHARDLLTHEGWEVATIAWDSGVPVSGSTDLWSFREWYVMWESWSGTFSATSAETVLDAMDNLDMLSIRGAEQSIEAAVDTDELIARLRPIPGPEGVKIIHVNGREVEVDFDAGTARRLK